MTWILGKDSLKNITVLSEAIKSKKLDLFNKENSSHFFKYHPFMSMLPGMYKEKDFSEIYSLSPKKGLIYEDKQLLDLCENYLNVNSIPLSGISEEEMFCHINDKRNPELFSEAITSCKSALTRLELTHPTFFSIYAVLIECIIPLHSKTGNRRALSTSDGFGALFMSLNPLYKKFPETHWLFDIAHELGHNVLLLYQLTDRVLASDYQKEVWSCIRKTKRPAIGALHAIIALAYMIEVLYMQITSEIIPTKEKLYIKELLKNFCSDQHHGLIAINVCIFTELGTDIMLEIQESLQNIQKYLNLTVSRNISFKTSYIETWSAVNE